MKEEMVNFTFQFEKSINSWCPHSFDQDCSYNCGSVCLYTQLKQCFCQYITIVGHILSCTAYRSMSYLVLILYGLIRTYAD